MVLYVLSVLTPKLRPIIQIGGVN